MEPGRGPAHIHTPIAAATLAGSVRIVYAGAMETNARLYEAPPVRDRLPTIPHDLSEYARSETGPDLQDDPLRSLTAGPLVDLWPSDVPSVVGTAQAHAERVDHREAFVLSLLDGESSLEELAAAADLPGAEILTVICELCARGIVTLDRSQRATLLRAALLG